VTSPDIAPAVPTAVLELAASCVRFVHTKLGVELDFTQDTLPLLDHYMKDARAEVQARPEVATLILHSSAAYFGQLLASQLTGFWRASDPNPDTWLLCLQPVFLAINPVGVSYDVLSASQRHDGPSSELLLDRADRELVEQRLNSVPEVSESDFFTFGTRYEAIEIAVEALRGQMVEGGMEDVSFEPGDYADAFG